MAGPRTERLVEAVEGARVIDPLAERLAGFWSRTLSSERLRDLLSGRQLGHPLHPAAVLVPAGTLLSATALDLVGGPDARRGARRLVGLGLLAAGPAALAGWSDWLDTQEAERRVGVVHAASNAVGLSAYALSWWQRRQGRSGRLAGLAGAGVLGVGGWLGGHLAYAQGVGVDTTAFQAGPTEWTDAGSAADVTDVPRRVDVGGVPLLVTRLEGRIVVLADRCTHRGGSLSEGKRDGDCVVCPWHGSRFALGTGAVRRGPATRPQPRYEVRARDGRLQVRRREERALRVNPVDVSTPAQA
ncbi:Rieske (2Fe-2S) protein [Pseudofrankia inefficax]|nr:non-heme iron oxygenase ferredoxin subunit [Pseudofrankia inefficax]